MLDLRLSALENAGRGKVVTNPKIATLDNTEALIESGGLERMSKKEGLHLLPNRVQALTQDEGLPKRRSRQVLYPIRAIRRKNIGEAILVSLFFRQGDRLAVTLPPNSPADQEGYATWKAFVQEYHLPVSHQF